MTEVSRSVFLRVLRSSMIVDEFVLARAEARPEAATVRELADLLIASGDLTHFQAEKLRRGHWRGLQVGPYRILAPLGRGGMGTVFLAQDGRLAAELGDEVLVALKVLPPRVARAEPRTLARFQRELELGRQTSHPNVTRTLAGGEIDGVHYIALEYVPGKTVRQLVEAGGGLSVGSAARIFADVAAGLTHLHERGMVHRDLKPSNVMVRPDGQAKLLDFGLALVPYDPRPSDPAVIGGKGYIVGTMDFIAPEQARNAAGVTPRSDLYSLGCSLYYAVTGTLPFPGGDSKDKIRRQRTLVPPPVTELKPDIDRDFAGIIEQLMAKEPSGRPASAAVVRDLLLPWATVQAPARGLTLQQAVEDVDRPDAHPELWNEQSGSETARLEPEANAIELDLPRASTSAPDALSWLIFAAAAAGLALVAAVLIALRGC